MRSARPARSSGIFEYGMWLFTRVSGLLLIIFAAVNLAAAFLLGGRKFLDMPTFFRWMFFPNPLHVVNSDIPDVTLGWSNAFWQVFAIVMILVAAIHGFNGLRMVMEDYFESPLLVALLRILTFILLVGSLIVAVYVIITS